MTSHDVIYPCFVPFLKIKLNLRMVGRNNFYRIWAISKRRKKKNWPRANSCLLQSSTPV